MKKIITAMNEPKLNETLKKEEGIEVLAPDISYQEAVFEILEKNKNIQILIISELLNGKIEFIDFIKKIQNKNNNLKIIIILEKENKEKIEKLKQLKINNILIHNKTSINETIKLIKNIQVEKNIENEIEELKKLIIENKKENKYKKIKIKDFLNNIFENKNKVNINKNKIISLTGTSSSGKTILSACMAKELKSQNKKIILIDFDLLNNDLITVFGKNKKIKKENKNNKIKINKKLDLICGINLLNSEKKLNIEKFNNMIDELKEEYELIIIDTSYECFFNYNKLILEKSDEILFLTEANLLDIKKSINLLKIYKNEWKIENEKIKIIFNKYNKYSVDEKILKNLFYDYKILGKIKFSNEYDLLINKNLNLFFEDKKIINEHKKIIKKIINKI